MNIETLLAEASMDKVDARDAEKTYHKKSLAQLQKYVPTVEWRAYFTGAGIPKVPYVITAQPEFLKVVGSLLHKLPLEDWKVYLEWHLADDASTSLPKVFFKPTLNSPRVLRERKKKKGRGPLPLGVEKGPFGEPF